MVDDKSRWDEPLAELARFSFDFAQHFCDPAVGCTYYHKAWSTLRFFEAGGALPAGFDFFRRELLKRAAQVGTDRMRVLISGAADTGLSAMVLRALRPEGIEPEIVSVDRCRTTLEQQALFFRMRQVASEFFHGDAVDLDTAPVDAVISHSFMGFVPPERRYALIRNWARLMAPGGRAIVTERFSKEPGQTPSLFKPQELEGRKAGLTTRLRAASLSEQEITQIVLSAQALWEKSGQRYRMAEWQFREAVAEAGLTLAHYSSTDDSHNVSPIASKFTAESPRVVAVAVRE